MLALASPQHERVPLADKENVAAAAPGLCAADKPATPAAAEPLSRSGSTPPPGKVSALARMFAARVQSSEAAPTAARGSNAERVAAIRRRFSLVAQSHTATALRLPGSIASFALRTVPDDINAALQVSVVAPRVDDAARLRAEVNQLQTQLIKHVAEVSLLRAMLSEATAAAAPAVAAEAAEAAEVGHDDIAALASRLVDAERAEGELDAAADEIAALEEALEAAEADAEEAAAAVDAAAARAHELQGELTAARAAAEKDAACAREQAAMLQADLQEAMQRADAADNRVAAAMQSVAESQAMELSNARASADSTSAAAAAETAQLREALEQMTASAAAARAEAAAQEARFSALLAASERRAALAESEAASHAELAAAASQRAEVSLAQVAAAKAETATAQAVAAVAQARADGAEACARSAEQDAARVCDEAAAAKAAAAAETAAAESAKSVAAVMRDALSLAAKDVFAARTAAAQLRRRNTKLEARRAEIAASMTALMQKVANLGSAMGGPQATAEVRQPAELLRISAQVKLLALDAEMTGHSSGSVAGSDVDAGEVETSSELRTCSAADADLASLQLRLWELTSENERLHGALAAALPAEQCRALRAGGTSTPMRQDKEALEEQLSVLLAERTAANASFAAAKREVTHLKQRLALLESEHEAALAAADEYAATAQRLAARVGQLEAALVAVHAVVESDAQPEMADAEAACTTPTACRKRGDAVLARALAEESGCTSEADESYSEDACSSPSAADLVAGCDPLRMSRAEALLARATATPTVTFSLDGGFESAAESDTPCTSALTAAASTPSPLNLCRGDVLLARAAAPSACGSAPHGRASYCADDETTDCDDSSLTFTPRAAGPAALDCPGSVCSAACSYA